MALKPRMTRAAARVCMDALRYYLPTIDNPERRQVAIDTINNLFRELNHAAQNRAKREEPAIEHTEGNDTD